MANQGALLSRRQFLISMFVPAIAKPVISYQSLVPGATKPEFNFGELVEFQWVDENSGQHHSESGEIAGMVWNFPEARWEYTVIWLNSTAYPAHQYPIADSNLISVDVLSRVKA